MFSSIDGLEQVFGPIIVGLCLLIIVVLFVNRGNKEDDCERNGGTYVADMTKPPTYVKAGNVLIPVQAMTCKMESKQ